MKYNYKNALNRINGIFDNQLIKTESLFQPNTESSVLNGTKSWVGVMVVNFDDMESLIDGLDDNQRTQLIKSLFQEVILILKGGPRLYNLIVNRFSIVAIYAAQYKSDLLAVFDNAVMINTFSKMYNKVLESHGIVPIQIGLGIAANKEIIIKLTDENKQYINDIYWLGDSLETATKLSRDANKRSIKSIAISRNVHDNIIDALLLRNKNYSNWIIPKYIENKPMEQKFLEYYHSNIVKTVFDSWINNEMHL